MKSFTYLVNTWLLALALLPLGFYIGARFVYWGSWVETFIAILLVGFVFSILPLLLSAFILPRILFLDKPIELRMILWLLTVCISIVLSSWFIASLLGINERETGFLVMAVPAAIAAFISLILRYRQFRNLCKAEDGGDNYLKEEGNYGA